jgi:hypothetical protein
MGSPAAAHSKYADIIRAVRDSGEHGITLEDIALATGIQGPNTIDSFIKALEKVGQVRSERKVNRRGRKSTHYIWSEPAVAEGCTPTDARVLRDANFRLVQQVHDLQNCLIRIVADAEKFVGDDS